MVTGRVAAVLMGLATAIAFIGFNAAAEDTPQTVGDLVRVEANPPSDAERLASDYQAAMYRALEADLREQYLELGDRSDAWDDEVLKLIRMFAAWRVSGRNFWGRAHEEHVLWETIRETTHGIADKDCTDPLWRMMHCVQLGGNTEWADEQSRVALDGLRDRGVSGYALALAIGKRLSAMRGDREAREPLRESFAEACRSIVYRPIDDPMEQAATFQLVRGFYDAWLSSNGYEWHVAEYERFRDRPTPNPWLNEVMLARLSRSAAARSMAYDTNNELPREEREANRRRWHDRVVEHATKADEIDATHPHAVVLLIERHGQDHEVTDPRLVKLMDSLSSLAWQRSAFLGTIVDAWTPEPIINDPKTDPGVHWLAEAIDRVPDWPAAFRAYERVWGSRRGTRPNDRWELAMAALDADRFDTMLPEVFWGMAHRADGGTVESLDADEWAGRGLNDAEVREKHSPYWAHPRVWAAFERYFGGRLAHPYPLVEYDRRMKSAPAVAWKCGQYAAAARWIELLGDDFDPRVFRDYGGTDQLAASECFARADARVAYVLGAVAPGRSVEPSVELSKRLDRLLAELPEDHRGRLYLQTLRGQGEWNAALVDDEPLVLIGSQRKTFDGWIVSTGDWSIDERGRITGTSQQHEHYSGLGLLNPIHLTCCLELQGQITVLEGNSRTNASVMFDFWESDYRHKYRSVAFYPDRDEVYLAEDGYRDRAEFAAPMSETIRFRIARIDGQVWVQVNGKLVVNDETLPGRYGEHAGRIAIGGAYWKPGVRLRFDLLAIRKIEAPPGWTSPAPRAPGS